MAIVYTFIFIIGVCANLVVIIVIGLDPQGCDKYFGILPSETAWLIKPRINNEIIITN